MFFVSSDLMNQSRSSYHLFVDACCQLPTHQIEKDKKSLGNFQECQKRPNYWQKSMDIMANANFVSVFNKEFQNGQVLKHWFLEEERGAIAKLYIPSTLNTDYLLWHTQLIVCAVKY